MASPRGFDGDHADRRQIHQADLMDNLYLKIK